MSNVYVCVYKQTSTQDQEGLGGCSPRKFLEIRCSEVASGAILGQNQRHSSYYFIQFLPVLHAFAKPADFKFPREKVLRLAYSRCGDSNRRTTGELSSALHSDLFPHVFMRGLSLHRSGVKSLRERVWCWSSRKKPA